MTGPIGNTAGGDPLPGLMTAAVQQAVEQSRALGLTWTLRLATATSVTEVILDGDDKIINVISMIGPLFPTMRLYVMMIPPAGNFVVGGAYGFRKPAVGAEAVRSLTTQSIPSGVATDIIFDGVAWDSSGYATAGQASLLVPSANAGVFLMSLRVEMSPATSGTRNYLQISVSSSGIPWRTNFVSGETDATVFGVASLIGGATITTSMFQNSGGALGIIADFIFYRVTTY
jgi:hypothetical protein